MNLELSYLGPFQVTQDGQPLSSFRNIKTQALLIYLTTEAAFAGGTARAYPREHLMALLWPDSTLQSAQANLRQAVYLLRKMMPCVEARSGDGLVPLILSERETIQLNPEAVFSCDITAFLALAGQKEDPDAWEKAERIYRDDFCIDFFLADSDPFEEWVAGRRAALRREALVLLGNLTSNYLLHNLPFEAERTARRQIQLDNFWEIGHQQLMQALAAGGNRLAAVAHYEIFRKLIADELQTTPSIEIEVLLASIEEKQDSPPPGMLPTRMPIGFPPFLRMEMEATPPLIVARHRELTQLNEFLNKMLAGIGQVAIVLGEAGTGKTTLLQTFLHNALATYPELLVVASRGNSHSGYGDPFLSFRLMMHAFVGDLEPLVAGGLLTQGQGQRLWRASQESFLSLKNHGPNLINRFVSANAVINRMKKSTQFPPTKLSTESPPIVLDDRLQYFDEYLAFLQGIANSQPLIIFLDDLQWIDAASLDFLTFLSTNLGQQHILVLGAYRPEEIQPRSSGFRGEELHSHPLEKFLSSLKRSHGDVQINLDKTIEETADLFVDALLDSEPNVLDNSFRTVLRNHTGGHPLFTVELLRALQERGDIFLNKEKCWEAVDSLNWQTMPVKIEGVIEERINRLDAELRSLVDIASVEGEEFIAQIIASVSGHDERVVLRRLSRELEKRYRLVSGQGGRQRGSQRINRFRFRHNLLQSFLYSALDMVEKEIIHHEVGEALEDLYKDRPDEVVPLLAWHFSRAGDPRQAIPFLLAAGDLARGLHAYEEAQVHYDQAIEFLKMIGDTRQSAHTWMKLGLTFHQMMKFDRAQKAFDEGFSYWQQIGPECQQPSSSETQKELRLTLDNFPATFDPGFATDNYSTEILNQVMAGLVRCSPELDILPEMAEEWKILENGKRYVFKLRRGIKWSDGNPLTAQDFEFAWKRVLNPTVNSPGAQLLFDIREAKSFNKGLVDWKEVGISCQDKTTLIIDLSRPVSYFLYILGLAVAGPVPRHILSKHGGSWSENGLMVCNGPFVIEECLPERKLILKRNDLYTGSFSGNIGSIVLHFNRDAQERFENYKEDGADVFLMWGLPQPQWQRLRQQFAKEYVNAPFFQTTFLICDLTRPPLNDKNLRRALAMSIDKGRLANIILNGSEYPANGGMVPPGIGHHIPDIGLPFDPEHARYLVETSGYQIGELSSEIIAYAPDRAHQVCDFLAAQWADHLKLNISWRFVDWKQHIEKSIGGKFNLLLTGWVADYPDADNFLRTGREISGGGCWKNKDFDALLERARASSENDERRACFAQAEKIMLEEVTIIPLLYGRLHMLVKPRLTRFPTSPLQLWYGKEVRIGA